MKWAMLIMGIIANASASVMVKLAILPLRQFSSFSNPIVALNNWPFWVGLGIWCSVSPLCRSFDASTTKWGTPGVNLRNYCCRYFSIGTCFSRTFLLDCRRQHLAGNCRGGNDFDPSELISN
jgi:hypothetical protein